MRLACLLLPCLTTAFPVLFLYAQNCHQMALRHLWVPLILAIVGTVAVATALSVLTQQPRFGGIATSVFAMGFFSYGHVLLWLQSQPGQPAQFAVPIAAGLILVWCGALIYALWSHKDGLRAVHHVSLGIVSALVAIQVCQAAVLLTARHSSPAAATDDRACSPDRPESLPDIYFIILDGYARSDVLADVYNYDNSVFVDWLDSVGFHIGSGSYANYPQTVLSLTASLNMDYLSHLGSFSEYSRDLWPLTACLRNSRVEAILRAHGYTTVTFATGYELSEIPNSDHFLSSRGSVNYLTQLLVQTTPLQHFLGRDLSEYDQHRDRVEFTLWTMADLDEIPGPKFVMAHIVAPHPPFVYAGDGSPVDPELPYTLVDGDVLLHRSVTQEQYVAGYRAQLHYITGRIQAVLARILATHSRRPPIIVLQSDHGPGSRFNWNLAALSDLKERFGMLNACYFGGANDTAWYSSISPVNTFRLILSRCFDLDLPLLADSSFYSPRNYPYQFTYITDRLPGADHDTKP